MGALPLDGIDPFAVLSASARRVVAVLRGRHRGGPRPGLCERLPHEIEDAGLAVRESRPVASFHIPESVVVWSVSDSAWAALRWVPPRRRR